MLDVELQSYGKGSSCSYKIIFEDSVLCEGDLWIYSLS